MGARASKGRVVGAGLRGAVAVASLGLVGAGSVEADEGAATPAIARVRAAIAMPRSLDEGAWLRLADASIVTPAWQRGGLDGVSARLPSRAQGARVMGLGRVRRFQIEVTLEGAAPTPAILDGDAVAYKSAFPSTDVVILSHRAAYEESWLLRDAAAPTHFVWRVSLGSGFSSAQKEGGALVFVDRRGHGVLEIPSPFVVDAHGATRAVAMHWDGERVHFDVPTAGLVYPLVVDPGLVESASWTQLTPPSDPTPRAGHGMTWDPIRKAAVLFGGVSATSAGANAYVGDIAEWLHDHWYFKFPTTTPAARGMSPLVYVPGVGVVFADGQSAGGTTYADAFSFDLANTQWLPIAGAPSMRSGHGFAFHAARGQAVLVGGGPTPTGSALSDWATLAPSKAWGAGAGAGPAVRDAMAVYMDVDQRVHVFGGRACVTGCPPLATAQTLGAAGGWSPMTYAGEVPAARYGAAAAYDTDRKRTVLFGGTDSGQRFADTAELTGTRWYKRAVPNSPPARAFAAMAYDAVDKRMILFGGSADAAEPESATSLFFSDTWAYTAASAACTTDAQCDTGHCVDGACCEAATCGSCQTCGAPTDPGFCVPVLSAADPDSCAGSCDALGQCSSGTGGSGGGGAGGAASGAGGVGGAGMGGAAAAGAGGGTMGGEAGAGGASLLGTPCMGATECGSLVCEDGACCKTKCSGACTTCRSPDALGTCVLLPKGATTSGCPSGCNGERADCLAPPSGVGGGPVGAAGAGAGSPPSAAPGTTPAKFDLATPRDGCALSPSSPDLSLLWPWFALGLCALRRRRVS